MQGYAGKFLEVDLSTESTKNVTFNESVLRNYIGGRGLATKILWTGSVTDGKLLIPLDPKTSS